MKLAAIVILALIGVSGVLGWNWHAAEQEIQDLYKQKSDAHVVHTKIVNKAKAEVSALRRQRTLDLTAKQEAHRRELSNVKTDPCFTKSGVVPAEYSRLLNDHSM